jgi:hypothetical protein
MGKASCGFVASQVSDLPGGFARIQAGNLQGC